ncbi:MAG TPA: UDP-N-acetylglucosamine--N-acetylmuramyl-(pentapeptide) pyrophosphoryl-undecaprenol N-acetylglucosamine transferase [Abditibacteriaceae bacterium]
MKTLRILVSGGGSSGHISPALAIISALNELAAQSASIPADESAVYSSGQTPTAWSPQYLYLGGLRGLEKGIVEAAGIPFIGVETGKLRRYFSRENFTDMLRVPVGVLQSLRHVRAFRPHVVLATGGYVAVPPVLAAALLRVPVVIHEQTVQIGLANRITGRFATRIGLSSELALEDLSSALRHKAFVVGNPVRPLIFGGDPAEAVRLTGFEPNEVLPTIYVTGGSQGARVINRAVEETLPQLLQVCRVIHQCGQQPAGDEQDYDRLTQASTQLSPELRRRYFLTRFVGDEIKHVFALADLVIGRAGAGTVNEVCALGKAALYIPLVPTRGDEQTRNARVCVEAGAANVIAQSELSGERLMREASTLLADGNRLRGMGEAARHLARPDAARDMAQAVVQLALKE